VVALVSSPSPISTPNPTSHLSPSLPPFPRLLSLLSRCNPFLTCLTNIHKIPARMSSARASLFTAAVMATCMGTKATKAAVPSANPSRWGKTSLTMQ